MGDSMKAGSHILQAILAAVALALPAVAANGQPSKPNFLVLLADDMRADAVGAYGNPAIKTPAIDRLIREGFSFREAHCMGSMHGAVCIPSRAMLMTGRGWMHLNMELKPPVETLPQILGQTGWQTFIAGKWHNGGPSCERSFQSGDAVFLGGMTDQFHPKLSTLRNHRLGEGRVTDGYSTDAIADAAVAFLKRQGAPAGEGNDGDERAPFFAWVAFTVPHDPRTPKEKLPVTYDPATMALPKNFLPQHPFDNGWLTVRDEELLGWPRQPDEIRRELAAYYAMISHMDARIGDILDVLQRQGLAENTYVCFLADHGLALGSHGLLGKQSLYEHSMKAPFVLRGPGVPAGKETRALTYLHDLTPTLFAKTGIDWPGDPDDVAGPDCPGQSLWPLIEGQADGWRKTLFTAFSSQMRALRDERWKIIRYPRVNVTQLFDLQSDPDEMNDLSAKEPERVKAMLGQLAEHQKESDDRLALTVDKPSPATIDLSGRAANPKARKP